MIPGEFDYQLNLQKSLATCPNVRGVVDTVKDLEMFIYPYLSGDLLRLSQRKLSEDTRRYILRCALQGLVDLHDRDILHNGKYLRSEKHMIMRLTDCRHQAQ
ncbi:hypothetical protein V6Z92_009210 [Aspergillus fumigatus]|jgi:serine/threonine protein kinase